MATVVQRAGVNDNDYELTISVTTSVDTDTQAVVVRVVEAAEDSGVARSTDGSISTSLRKR